MGRSVNHVIMTLGLPRLCSPTYGAKRVTPFLMCGVDLLSVGWNNVVRGIRGLRLYVSTVTPENSVLIHVFLTNI